MSNSVKKIVFTIILLVSLVLLSELAVKLVVYFSSRAEFILHGKTEFPMTVKDKKLGIRPNPKYLDHDRLGFRNRGVPESIDVIALGDSQTYGSQVPRSQAWSQQLGRELDIKTYQMAFGGYGPVHSLILLEEAIKLNPNIVIVAIYMGNDLLDSYRVVYRLNGIPELRSADSDRISLFKRYDSSKSKIANRKTKKLYRKTQNNHENRGIRQFLSRKSSLYAVAKLIKNRYLPFISYTSQWDSVQKSAQEMGLFAFSDKNVKTVFTADYRLIGLNKEDPRIVEGFDLSVKAVIRMKKRTEQKGIKFYTLIIPTKEMVFNEIVQRNTKKIPNEYKRLISSEMYFYNNFLKLLKDNKINLILPLLNLQQKTAGREQLYFISWDGHPNPKGHRVIANSVKEAITIN
jgi:lysophospholipase L1-like esterase